MSGTTDTNRVPTSRSKQTCVRVAEYLGYGILVGWIAVLALEYSFVPSKDVLTTWFFLFFFILAIISIIPVTLFLLSLHWCIYVKSRVLRRYALLYAFAFGVAVALFSGGTAFLIPGIPCVIFWIPWLLAPVPFSYVCTCSYAAVAHLCPTCSCDLRARKPEKQCPKCGSVILSQTVPYKTRVSLILEFFRLGG